MKHKILQVSEVGSRPKIDLCFDGFLNTWVRIFKEHVNGQSQPVVPIAVNGPDRPFNEDPCNPPQSSGGPATILALQGGGFLGYFLACITAILQARRQDL